MTKFSKYGPVDIAVDYITIIHLYSSIPKRFHKVPTVRGYITKY